MTIENVKVQMGDQLTIGSGQSVKGKRVFIVREKRLHSQHCNRNVAMLKIRLKNLLEEQSCKRGWFAALSCPSHRTRSAKEQNAENRTMGIWEICLKTLKYLLLRHSCSLFQA